MPPHTRSSMTLALLGPFLPALAGLASPGAGADPVPSVVCSTDDRPLGMATGFTEFIRHDAQRVSDSEGIVAYGGDATLGDPAYQVGFSIGSGQPEDSVGPDLPADPGVHRLIVGGTVDATQVVILGGSARVGSYAAGSQAIDVPQPLTQGPPTLSDTSTTPVDFDHEFAELAATSRLWDELPATGAVTSVDSELTLQGDRPGLNVFHLTKHEFEGANSIRIRVPAGSTILVDVDGDDLSMNAAPLATISIWDPATGDYVVDDHFINGLPIPSSDWLQLRQSLVWNFPDATHILKNYVSWPGTIVAPGAAFEFGRGTAIGPGHVNGQLIADSVTSAIGAETHHLPLVSTCLPMPAAAVGSLDVVKRLEGRVSADPLTVSLHLDCDGSEFDQDVSVPIPAGARSGRTTVPGLPADLVCTVTEPDVTPGWRLVDIAPAAAVVGTTPSIVVTNTREPESPTSSPTPSVTPTPSPSTPPSSSPTEMAGAQPSPHEEREGWLPQTGLPAEALPLAVAAILSLAGGLALLRRRRAR